MENRDNLIILYDYYGDLLNEDNINKFKIQLQIINHAKMCYNIRYKNTHMEGEDGYEA